MSNCRSIIIFRESFDAKEFLDRVDLSDIDDHFDMPEYQSRLMVNNFTEPSCLTPHAVVIENISKYDVLVDSYKPLILTVEQF